jgi:glycosyltransferase involved in cell wall biosynthesis
LADSGPLVSVCVPLASPSHFLTECLDGVYSQTYRNVEIIVIGRPLAEKMDTRSEQKNRAIMSAKGEFVYICDSDTVLKEDAIGKAVAMCLGGFDFVAINNRSVPDQSLIGRIRQVEWEVLQTSIRHSAGHFFRRADVIKVGLFDESLYAGEDYDLHNRMLKAGFRFGIVDSWRVHLGEPDSMKDVVSKNLYYGRNIQVYVSKNGVLKVSPLRATYVKHIPSFGLLFFPFLLYKMVQYLSVFVGMTSR